jgi:RNA recognition motif-containing protein
MSDTDWSEVSSKKSKNRTSVAGGTPYYASSSRVVQVAGVKTGTGRKAPVPQGKVFVGGLSWDTDEASLHSYFSEYGEICALEIPRGENKVICPMRHCSPCHLLPSSAHLQVPRGFAFVTFTDPDVVAEVVGPRHWIDNHPVEVKPAVGIGHEALQQPGKSLASAASVNTKAAAVDCTALQSSQTPNQPLSAQNSNAAAPSQTPAAPLPTPAPSRPITAWSGAVVKNAAAAAAANLPVFTPDDFPPALSTKSTTSAPPVPPKPSMSYASMVGRPPPASQPSRSIASVGSAADMTSENRR